MHHRNHARHASSTARVAKPRFGWIATWAIALIIAFQAGCYSAQDYLCEDGAYPTLGPDGPRCLPYSTCAPGAYERRAPTRTTDRACAPCPSGTYTDRDDVPACEPIRVCPPGERLVDAGASSADAVCAPCPIDDLSTAPDSIACSPRSICPPGTFVRTDGYADEDRGCEPCPDETFSASTNARSCVARRSCAPGTFVVRSGSSSEERWCASCSAGTYSNQGDAVECATRTVCPAGSYMLDAGDTTHDGTCVPCPVGTSTDGPSRDRCLPPGVCPAGTRVDPVLGSCATCVFGSFCAGDQETEVDCAALGAWDHDADPATPCAARRTCVEGEYVAFEGDATTDRRCARCSPGSYSESANSPTCTAHTPCGDGFVESNEGTSTSDRTCASDTVFSAFGTSSWEHLRGMVLDREGGAIVIGNTEGAFAVSGSPPLRGDFLASFDRDGGLRYLRAPGFDAGIAATAIARSSDGGFVVGADDRTETSYSGSQDAWRLRQVIGRFDADGQLRSTTELASGVRGYVHAVAEAPDRGIVAAGYFEGEVVPDAWGGGRDAFIAKVDAHGALEWMRQLGDADEESILSTAIDAEGRIYVAGSTHPPRNGPTGVDWTGFIGRLDRDGNVEWWHEEGVGLDGGTVLLDGAGGVYVVGTMPIEGSTLASSTRQPFVLALDSSGASRLLARLPQELGHVDAATFDPRGRIVVGTSRPTPGRGLDLLVTYVDLDGSVVDQRVFSTESDDCPVALAIDALGRTVVAAASAGSFPGTTNLGALDGLLVRYPR